MSQLQELFDQYGKAHSDSRNKICHKIGIPLIIVSLIALITQGWGTEWAWWMFGIGWAFQFIGHAFERTWPEFMKNPIFLAIGPLYFVNEIIKKFKRAP